MVGQYYRFHTRFAGYGNDCWVGDTLCDIRAVWPDNRTGWQEYLDLHHIFNGICDIGICRDNSTSAKKITSGKDYIAERFRLTSCASVAAALCPITRE